MGYILQAYQVCARENLGYPDIDIAENRTTFISGESGSGKSTLLKLFNATVTPLQGEVTYKGQNVLSMDTVALRREVLLVAQMVFLFEGTIEDNFRQYYAYREMPPPSAAIIKAYLELCCLDLGLSALCPTLSGGERQRVFIAIGLSFLPKVLMLDEPTSALDERTAKKFFEQVTVFCRENAITLLVVSHDRSLADQFADDQITLEGRGSL